VRERKTETQSYLEQVGFSHTPQCLWTPVSVTRVFIRPTSTAISAEVHLICIALDMVAWDFTLHFIYHWRTDYDFTSCGLSWSRAQGKAQ